MLSGIFLGILVLGLVMSVWFSNKVFAKGASKKVAVMLQVLMFVGVSVFSTTSVALAATQSSETTTSSEVTTTQGASTTEAKSDKGLGYIGMAIAIGAGCLGAGIAVASAASAAIGATSEDPKTFGKSLVFVALAEGVTIFALLIAIFIYVQIM